jgi:UDP-glucose 4-epimerase
MTRILINGIDGLLGARVAELLSACPDVTVLGVGQQRPPAPVGRAEYLLAHLGGRQLLELLRSERVDVVVHLDFAGAERPAHSREEAVQHNVLGSMELVGACAAAGVERVLLRSHTRVYGASPLNPTFIGEQRPVKRSNAPGVLRDYTEVEQFVAEFAARHPNLAVVQLRCAPLLGGWSPFVNYLSQPSPRMLVGFDPTVQVLHLEDAASAFALAALADVCGPLNLAASDTVCLSQAIKLAGRQPTALLEPMVELALAMGNGDVLGNWPYDMAFLRHSCVADTRRAHEVLGWTPAYSAVDALMHMQANGSAPSRELSEEALRAFLVRRSQP